MSSSRVQEREIIRRFIPRGVLCGLCQGQHLCNEIVRWQMDLTDRHLALEVGACARHADAEILQFLRRLLGIAERA